MPAALIAPAIGAVGSVAGGIASGKGASKAAKIQAQASAQQTQALQAMYGENVARMQPTYDRGEAAQSRVQTLLGLPGGDGSNPQAALAATPGYQFALKQSLASSNANAYASGLGNSGAALKALQDRAAGLATQNYNNYVGQLGSVADRGVSAMNGIVQQGNYTTGATNTLTQNNADSQSANAVYQGNNLANIIKGVANAGGQAFGSSYGATPVAGATPQGTTSPAGRFGQAWPTGPVIPGFGGGLFDSSGRRVG